MLDEPDLFSYDMKFIKEKVSNYNCIIDEKNKFVLLEHTGLLRLFNEIIGDSILMVYYQLYFNELYYADLSTLQLNEVIYKHSLFINCTDKVILKTTNGFSIFTGFIKPLTVNDFYIN